jgi:hypothetical protein
VYFVTEYGNPGRKEGVASQEEATEEVSEAEEHEDHDRHHRGDQTHHLKEL